MAEKQTVDPFVGSNISHHSPIFTGQEFPYSVDKRIDKQSDALQQIVNADNRSTKVDIGEKEESNIKRNIELAREQIKEAEQNTSEDLISVPDWTDTGDRISLNPAEFWNNHKKILDSVGKAMDMPSEGVISGGGRRNLALAFGSVLSQAVLGMPTDIADGLLSSMGFEQIDKSDKDLGDRWSTFMEILASPKQSSFDDARDTLDLIENNPIYSTDIGLNTLVPALNVFAMGGTNPAVEGVIQKSADKSFALGILRLTSEISARIGRDATFARFVGGGFMNYLGIQSAGYATESFETASNTKDMMHDENIDPESAYMAEGTTSLATGFLTRWGASKLLGKAAKHFGKIGPYTETVAMGVENATDAVAQQYTTNEFFRMTGQDALARDINFASFGIPFAVSLAIGAKNQIGAHKIKTSDEKLNRTTDALRIEQTILEKKSDNPDVAQTLVRDTVNKVINDPDVVVDMNGADVTNFMRANMNSPEGPKQLTRKTLQRNAEEISNGAQRQWTKSAVIGEEARMIELIDIQSRAKPQTDDLIKARSQANKSNKSRKNMFRNIFLSLGTKENIQRVYESEGVEKFVGISRRKKRNIPTETDIQNAFDGSVFDRVDGDGIGPIRKRMREEGLTDTEINLYRNLAKEMIGELRKRTAKSKSKKLLVSDLNDVTKQTAERMETIAKQSDNAYTMLQIQEKANDVLRIGGYEVETKKTKILEDAGAKEIDIGDQKVWQLDTKSLRKNGSAALEIVGEYERTRAEFMKVASEQPTAKGQDKIDVYRKLPEENKELHREMIQQELNKRYKGFKNWTGRKSEKFMNMLDMNGNARSISDNVNELFRILQGNGFPEKQLKTAHDVIQDAGKLEAFVKTNTLQTVRQMKSDMDDGSIDLKNVRRFLDTVNQIELSVGSKNITPEQISDIGRSMNIDDKTMRFSFKLANVIDGYHRSIAEPANAGKSEALTEDGILSFRESVMKNIPSWANTSDEYRGNSYYPFRISEIGKKTKEGSDLSRKYSDVDIYVNPNMRRDPAATIRFDDGNRLSPVDELTGFFNRMEKTAIYKPVENAINNAAFSLFGTSIARDIGETKTHSMTSALHRSAEAHRNTSKVHKLFDNVYQHFDNLKKQTPERSFNDFIKTGEDAMWRSGNALTGWYISGFNQAFHLFNSAQVAFTGSHALGIPIGVSGGAKGMGEYVKNLFKSTYTDVDSIRKGYTEYNKGNDLRYNKTVQYFFRNNQSESNVLRERYGRIDDMIAPEMKKAPKKTTMGMIGRFGKRMYRLLPVSHMSSQVGGLYAANKKVNKVFNRMKTPPQTKKQAQQRIPEAIKELGLDTFLPIEQAKLTDHLESALRLGTEEARQDFQNKYAEALVSKTSLQYESIHDPLYMRKARKSEYRKSMMLSMRFLSFMAKNTMNWKGVVNAAQNGNSKPIVNTIALAAVSQLLSGATNALPDDFDMLKRTMDNYVTGRTDPYATFSSVASRGQYNPLGMAGDAASFGFEILTGDVNGIFRRASIPVRNIETAGEFSVLVAGATMELAKKLYGPMGQDIVRKKIDTARKEQRETNEQMQRIPYRRLEFDTGRIETDRIESDRIQ